MLAGSIRTALDLAGELAAIPGERRRHTPRPPEHGLVVDVGGGQRPHPRADVVVDKYVTDSFEREGSLPLNLSRPLVVADGERLPFADGAASYVLAIHVLEHATDPVAFADELARIAPAGFVQVPSREAELTYGWPFHHWLIDRDGTGLRFEARDGRTAPVGGLLHDDLGTSGLHRLWFAAHRSRWHHSLEWRGRLVVTADGTPTGQEQASFDLDATTESLDRLHRTGRLAPLPQPVWNALRCPACRGGLAATPDEATCLECGRRYPVAGGVPLLLEEAVPAGR